MPEPADPEPKRAQRLSVHGHAVIAEVPFNDRAQPLAHFRDGIVHAPPEFFFHLIQLRLQPFTNRLPQHREISVVSLLSADMRKAEEIERLRFPLRRFREVTHRCSREVTHLLGNQELN